MLSRVLYTDDNDTITDTNNIAHCISRVCNWPNKPEIRKCKYAWVHKCLSSWQCTLLKKKNNAYRRKLLTQTSQILVILKNFKEILYDFLAHMCS